MNPPLLVHHGHVPVYRVVPRNSIDPLNASYSQKATDNRWNTPEFPALYCCCSELVAQSVVLDIYQIHSLRIEYLQPSSLPMLVEIRWSGYVVDAATAEGLAALGLDPASPEYTPKNETRRLAADWHVQTVEGVVYRSASMARRGFRDFTGSHERWGELAVFVARCSQPPTLSRIRHDLGWLTSQ
jgi:RES domain-containing protein